ncbi:unnamed protein product, partial [Scytosiphon promiscuus]
ADGVAAASRASEVEAGPAAEATAAAGVSAEAATAAVVAAAVEASFSPEMGGLEAAEDDQAPTLSMMLPGTSNGSNGNGEGGQVARITALVKTMSASVGVGGQEGARGKKPLTSVFDLDDTDCSALLELEELRLEDAPDGGGGGSGGGEEEPFREHGDSTDVTPRSTGVEEIKLSPALDPKETAAQGDAPASTPHSGGPSDGLASREVADAVLGAAGRGGKARDPNRGFSLSESDLMDGDAHDGSEMSVLDDDDDDDVITHCSETSGLDARESDETDEQEENDAAAAPAAGGDCDSRGRSPRRTVEEKGGVGGGGGGSGADAEARLKQQQQQQQQGGSGGAGGAQSVGPAAVGDTVGAKASAAPAPTASLGPASLGPGAVARAEGWADRDLLRGLIQPEETHTVLAAHDVSRSVGGVVVKRGLLLVCRNSVYFVGGFGREPALPRPDAPPLSPAAA